MCNHYWELVELMRSKLLIASCWTLDDEDVGMIFLNDNHRLLPPLKLCLVWYTIGLTK
jgi:hypothetical protein